MNPQPVNSDLAPRVISVGGGYWTGASAAFDLLTEHQKCAMIPEEFALLSYGQLLGNAAMREADRDVSATLVRGVFRMRQFNRPERLYPMRSILRRLAALAGFHPMLLTAIRAGMGRRLGVAYEQACERLGNALERPEATALTQEFAHLLDEIARSVVAGRTERTDAVVLDQFIGPAYAEAALDLCAELRCIFVDRDWRDQYAEVRDILPGMMATNARLGVCPSGENPADYRLTPLKFFLRVRQRIDVCRRHHEANLTGQILWLDFEDLVQETAGTAARVFGFLGLNPSEWRPNTNLLPEKSRKNVGKWRRFPHQRELEILAEQLPLPR